MTTPILGLPELAAGQIDAYLQHNAALRSLEAFGKRAVESITLAAPPTNPMSGDMYIPPVGAIGSWTGLTNKLVMWDGITWVTYLPYPGMKVWVVEDSIEIVFVNPGWEPAGGLDGEPTVPTSSLPAQICLPNSDFHLTNPAISNNGFNTPTSIDGVSSVGNINVGRGITVYANTECPAASKTFLIHQGNDVAEKIMVFSAIPNTYDFYRIVFLAASRNSPPVTNRKIEWKINDTILFSRVFANDVNWMKYDSNWVEVPSSATITLSVSGKNSSGTDQTVFVGEFSLYGRD